MRNVFQRLNSALAHRFPERRLFLRSDESTSYLRLRPLSQAAIMGGTALVLVWTLAATTLVALQSVGSRDLHAASERERSYFQERLAELSLERDRSVAEAQAAHSRYGEAMDRVATMQAQILTGEQRRAELERGVEAMQASLRDVTQDRDSARQSLASAEADVAVQRLAAAEGRLAEVEGAFDFLLTALRDSSTQRESLTALADTAGREVEHLALEYRLIQDRNGRIFTQLEQALETSMVPLERMFRAAGHDPQNLLRQVRNGYQAQSAALRPIGISTSGTLDPESDEARANGVISALEEINLYRLAYQRTPFAMPVNGARQTSPFGVRRDPRTGRSRMHSGLDWAAPSGTPIYATASGTVTFAGRNSGGYGNLVTIQHDFGLETYYAHLSSISVREGQRVSRGERVGGMGTTGRSTGVHLHYEIRSGGNPINPMTYIRAAQNVF